MGEPNNICTPKGVLYYSLYMGPHWRGQSRSISGPHTGPGPSVAGSQSPQAAQHLLQFDLRN